MARTRGDGALAWRALTALAREQHGVVARRQCRELVVPGDDGVPRRMDVPPGVLRARTRPVPGVRGVRQVLAPVDGPAAAAASAVLAVHAGGLEDAGRAGAAASHDTAAYLYAFWVPAPSAGLHVTLPARHPAHSRSGLTVHHADLPQDVVVLRGVPVTSPRRTVLDLLRADDPLWGIAAAESAVRSRWLHEDDLTTLAATVTRWPWARRVRQRVALVDARSESPLETAGRLVFTAAGLPPSDLQHPLPGDPPGRERRADMVWRDRSGRVVLAVEMDGAGPHGTPTAAFLDRRKDADMAELGWQVRRFTWADVRQRPHVMVDRIRRVLEQAA